MLEYRGLGPRSLGSQAHRSLHRHAVSDRVVHCRAASVEQFHAVNSPPQGERKEGRPFD